MTPEERAKILSKLTVARNASGDQTLINELTRIGSELDAGNIFSSLMGELDLLSKIASRFPDRTITVVVSFLNRLGAIELAHLVPDGLPTDYINRFETKEKLIIKSLGILNSLRYADFDLLHKLLDLQVLYARDVREDVAKAARENLGEIAKYNLRVYDHPHPDKPGHVLGPVCQHLILDYLEKLSETAISENCTSIRILCEGILSPTIEGTDWTYKTVTFNTRPVTASAVEAVRGRALNLLVKAYRLSQSLPDRKAIISSMQVATHTPHQGDYPDDLLNLVAANTAWILDFYIGALDGLDPSKLADLDLMMEIEHNAYWHHKRMNNLAVRDAALKVKSKIDSSLEYDTYKTLIGFNGIFNTWVSPVDIKNENIDDEIREETETRDSKLERLLESVTPSSYAEWTDRVVRYAQIKSNDLATFPNFGKFIEKVSIQHPDLGLLWLRSHADELGGFIPAILCGILISDRKEDALDVVQSWVTKGRFLAHTARAVQFQKEEYPDLIKQIAGISIERSDVPALRQIIATLTTGYTSARKELVADVIPVVLDKLGDLGDYSAPAAIWYMPEKDTFIGDLPKAAAQKILNLLLPAPSLRHELEEILVAIAKYHPDIVLNLLVARIKREDAGGDEKYDAIPYSFYSLKKVLAGQESACIAAARSLYDGNYGMFVYKGGRLIRSIFPEFSEEISQALSTLVDSGDETDIQFVMAILKSYDGDVRIQDVSRKIIEKVPEDSPLAREMVWILSATGVVSGEFGFSDAYEEKAKQTEVWLKDPSQKVKTFAEGYISYLRSAAKERHEQAVNEIKLQKFVYGAKEEDDES